MKHSSINQSFFFDKSRGDGEGFDWVQREHDGKTVATYRMCNAYDYYFRTLVVNGNIGERMSWPKCWELL